MPGPTVKGTYALLLHLGWEARLHVGRLAGLAFPAGYYLYLGSALGGLKGRLSRHLRRSVGAGSRPPTHWHIDYLLPHVRLEEVWWDGSGERLECRWATAAARAPGAAVVAPGFGSSDCRCPSHLVYFLAWPFAGILGAVHSLTLVAPGSWETSPPTPSVDGEGARG